MINTSIASRLAEGSISWLSYADRLMEFPTALLGVALQMSGGRFVTPYAFVRALKAGGVLAPAAVNPLAVRLLTIHGAKGLEAEAVLLLDTDTAPRSADSMSEIGRAHV